MKTHAILGETGTQKKKHMLSQGYDSKYTSANIHVIIMYFNIDFAVRNSLCDRIIQNAFDVKASAITV